jgi:hypothetical protein
VPADEDAPVLWWISQSFEHVWIEPGDEMPNTLLPPAVDIRKQQSCADCRVRNECRAAVSLGGPCWCERQAVVVRDGVEVRW